MFIGKADAILCVNHWKFMLQKVYPKASYLQTLGGDVTARYILP